MRYGSVLARNSTAISLILRAKDIFCMICCRPRRRTTVETEALQRMLLDEHGLRVSDAMSQYIAKNVQSTGTDEIPVIGGDAKTGVPRRMMIPSESIRSAMNRGVSA